MREGRRLTVHLLPGDPHALLLEEDVASFRPEALRRLGLSSRDTEVLCAAVAIKDELEIAAELFLSLHAVRERLERIEAKLHVPTAQAAVAQALSQSAWRPNRLHNRAPMPLEVLLVVPKSAKAVAG